MTYAFATVEGVYQVAEKRFSCFDTLSMNGESLMFSMPPPFALSLSKGERGCFSAAC
jgi:hypothetical protein